MENFITLTKKNDPFNLEFDLHKCDVSLANALRRTILTDVETIGFKTEPYNESNVKIIENTSSLHNEFILLRIGLIPIYFDVSKFDPNKYEFILDVHNKTENIINVTTNDFQVIDKDTGTNLDSNIFFPKNDITNDYILLLKLKPGPNNNGEKIHLKAKANISNGRDNARYSPVSCITYTNKLDPELYKEKYQEFAKTSNSNNPKQTFDITESERCFQKDENNRPKIFEFKIESVGVIPSHLILFNSLDIVKIKIQQFINNLKQNNSEIIDIQKSLTIMDSFDITIQNEDHTLGNLLQSYILNLNKDKVKFVGYQLPHPLKKEIFIRIKLNENNNVENIIKIIEETINNLITDIDNIKSELISLFKIPIIKKSIKVKSTS